MTTMTKGNFDGGTRSLLRPANPLTERAHAEQRVRHRAAEGKATP